MESALPSLVFSLVLAFAPSDAPPSEEAAAAPLHERIDALIEAPLEGRVSPPADDAEFLRRIHLDLHGRIPSQAEVEAFLADQDPEKRSKIVDRLLEAPEFALRMADHWDLVWNERRPDKHVKAPHWREFLRRAAFENRPYDRLVADIFAADGSEADPVERAASKFVLDRDADPHVLARDVGRLFLGRDMQCAQCHDHPLVDDYKQAHYYGLFAYFSRSAVVEVPGKPAALAEKADGDVTFASVFKSKVTHSTLPRVLDRPADPEPSFAKGDEYRVAPGTNVRHLPRRSRRALLAEELPDPEVEAFARNGANRLWALMMGRGLVHPLDMDHSDNPPSHPEVLEALTEEFVACGYDVKRILRAIANTRAYQRSSVPADHLSDDDLSPERYAVAPIAPLAAEPFGWSVMRALGIVESYRSAAESEIERDPRLKAIFEAMPEGEGAALRARMVAERVHDRLSPSLGTFHNVFGAAPGQPQDASDPTVQQALLLLNGEPVKSWLGTIAAQLAPIEDLDKLAEALHSRILSRPPDEQERAATREFLENRTGEARTAALKQLAWALLASAEFRHRH